MRRLRLGVRLTPRGIGVAGGSVVAFIASLWTSSFELLYVCGGLAAMVASAAGYALLLPSKVSVRRDLANDVLHASATTRVVLTFETESVLPVGMLTWQDHLPAALKGTARGVVDAVDQTDTSTASYEVRATRRGEHEVGPLDVSVGDPLGLVEVRRTVSGSSAVTILPTVVGLPVVRLGARSSGVSAWAPRQSVGTGEEDVIARPYVAGDAMRRIHWKATARHGELMTRQEEAIDDRRVAVVLDASAAAHGGEGDHDDLGDRPTFEWAVSAVASACARFVEHGDRVFLRVAGLKVVARDMSHEGYQDSLLDGLVDLGRINPTPPNDSHAIAATFDAVRHSDPALVLVVLGQIDTENAARWTAMAHLSVPISAVVSYDARPEALAILRDAGWHVVTYRPTDDIASIWALLDPSSGSSLAQA